MWKPALVSAAMTVGQFVVTQGSGMHLARSQHFKYLIFFFLFFFFQLYKQVCLVYLKALAMEGTASFQY